METALFTLIGSLACGVLTELPQTGLLATLLAGSVLLARGRLQLVAAIGIGFTWTALAATHVFADRLASERWNEEVTATVRIANFPHVRPGFTRFEARTVGRRDLPNRLRLSWYKPTANVAPGETWEFRMRLRPPRGFANPGTFDYERWLFLARIGATGYIVDPETAKRVAEPASHGLSALRQGLADRISAAVPGDPAAGILTALAVGSRHRLDAEAAAIFARTGTSHLMAISGLHIGLAAAVGLALGRTVVLLSAGAGSSITLRLVSALGALVSAGAYGALAGFTLPTRRACLMLTIAMIGWVAGRRVLSRHSLAAAILAVLTLWPLQSLTVAFQLSFSAVAILGLLIWREGRCLVCDRYSWLRFVRWQLLLTLLAIPLTQQLFGRISLIGPLANLVAIPFFSLVIVPLLGAGLLLGPTDIGEFVLRLAHACAGVSYRVLGKLSDLSFAAVELPVLPLSAWLFILMALIVAVLPWRRVYRAALLAALVPAAIPAEDAQIAPGCFRISLYDVGQGQSALIETAGHRLLFDTGPRFSPASDAATLVLIPSFLSRGIRFIDEVLVSHDDADHSGGLGSILNGVRVGRVRYSGDKAQYPHDAIRCASGQQWVWDGIRFEVLHPSNDFTTGNNASCVLRVSSGYRNALLAGDIERPAEARMTSRYANRLAADLLVVPHHGSATSSGSEFVAAVQPDFAWVAAGYRNRWGFPKETVVDRWRAAGASVQTTGRSGMLSARFCGDAKPVVSRGFRVEERRFWRAGPDEP